MTKRNVKTREGYDYWDKLCAIPRYGFLLSPAGNSVQQAKGIGNWIDMHAAQEVVDAAQDEINELREKAATAPNELLQFANELKQLCKDFSDRQDRPYMGDVTAAVDGLYEQFMLAAREAE